MGAKKYKPEIVALEKQLAPFLQNNPYSSVGKRGRFTCILTPWNDNSLYFLLEPKSVSDLIATVNNLVLPPRFTAVYHLDSGTMEYIYDLLETDDPCFARAFKFTLGSRSYSCKFAKTSERLLILAKWFRRTGKQSLREYRNLDLLREYLQLVGTKRVYTEDYLAGAEPISFFVSGFKKWDEDEVMDVSKHLNFFMQLYDRDSPYIIIHRPEVEELGKHKQLRASEIAFPKSISSRRRDPFLLDLALTANTATSSPRLQFIYYYQIVEYAAFYQVDAETKRHLLNIINIPDIHSNPDKYIPRILDSVSISFRQDEEARLEKVINAACRPEAIWEELQQNMSYFSKKVEFDGGVVLESFVPEGITKDDFCGMWHPKTAHTLRFIRNALVHGRERKFIQVISPTPRNDLLIKPWVGIVRCIAEHVIVFNSST